MQQQRLRVCGMMLAALALMTTIGYAQANPAAPPPVDGKWTGKVTAEMGEMPIAATLLTKNGIVSGVLTTGHGEFTIAEGKVVDGKWVLPFTTVDGGRGKLTGVPKGDTFSGEWDFRPMAFGTFELTRTK